MKSTPTWTAWQDMKQRCTNPNNPAFHYYGGRGIRVCSRWLDSFEAFLGDMGPRPDGLTLDRINVDGDYEPDNCQWVDWPTQAKDWTKVSRADVTRIRALYASGEATQRDLAERFGVSQPHINNIIHRRARADVA